MSEAKCMYDTMVEDGISPDRLIMEDKSKNTMENFRYSREVLADNDLGEDITVTTDSFHMLRAMLIVRQQGFKGRVGAVCAETRLEFLPTYVVREWVVLGIRQDSCILRLVLRNFPLTSVLKRFN